MLGSSASIRWALSSCISKRVCFAEFGGVRISRAGATSGYASGYETCNKRIGASSFSSSSSRSSVIVIR